MHGVVVYKWADDWRTFRLTISGMAGLEGALGKPVWDVYTAMERSEFRLIDVWCALRFGLVGGGMDIAAAERLMEKPTVAKLAGAVPIALAIMRAAFMPPPGEKLPDTKAGDDDAEKITLGTIYKNAFAVGIKPREVDDMTLWEFGQCVAGWNAAMGGEKEDAPSRDEIAALTARYG
jgi:hypothetical protein